ncbi:MAG: asparagine synthase (glutamine-hydrolyzing) [Segetibacter sp.]
MCGIAGFYSLSEIDNRESIIKNISDQLLHRGPDKQGHFNIHPFNLTFIHTRLSIIDLSEQANQPMRSKCGKFIISFNGEIYNHLEIRQIINKSYPNFEWQSTSDTETLVNGIALFGLDQILDLSRGMFAFSLFDTETRKIYLVKDRFGEKPLYWFWNNNLFLWASELKAMLEFNRNLFYVSIERIREYLNYGYIKSPNSVFANIYRIKPGEYLSFSLDNLQIQFTTYWTYNTLITNKEVSLNNPVDTLKNHLINAVKGTMLSDVPLGSFLSGGVDSSLITSIMVLLSEEKVNTFTVGFKDSELDESKYAAEVAKHLGTDHHELIMSYKDVTERIPDILNVFDEPFGDSSVVPTFLLAEYASKKVKVVLSGDGADEIFLGYNRYFQGLNLWKKLKKLPPLTNKMILTIINNTPNLAIKRALTLYQNIKNKKDQQLTNISQKISTLKQVLNSIDIFEYNSNLRLRWGDDIFFKSSQNLLNNKNWLKLYNVSDILVLSTYDQLFYLPDDILFKVDRSSMACSLETRAPFLNVEVVDFAASLDMKYKISNNSGKIILKTLLKQYLPEYMINRPKKGFGLPISEWLKGPLYHWVNDLLLSSSAIYSYIDKLKVLAVWKDHIDNKKDNSEKIWTLLCLILWLKNYNPRIQ